MIPTVAAPWVAGGPRQRTHAGDAATAGHHGPPTYGHGFADLCREFPVPILDRLARSTEHADGSHGCAPPPLG